MFSKFVGNIKAVANETSFRSVALVFSMVLTVIACVLFVGVNFPLFVVGVIIVTIVSVILYYGIKGTS